MPGENTEGSLASEKPNSSTANAFSELMPNVMSSQSGLSPSVTSENSFSESLSKSYSESLSETSDVDKNGMPLKLRLPRLRLLKSKESLPDEDLTKNNDTLNIDSLSTLASNDSLWIDQDPEENCGYTVNRLKSLCKLHKAVWKDDPVLVRLAIASLKKRMYVDYYDKDCRTALHFACARCHEVNVRLVCEAGANPNLADSDGATPMHKAVQSGCSDGVNHLLQIGGDPNLIDMLGRTPLHIAAKTGDIASALLLLQWNAFIDAIEKNGMTPLHVATASNHLKFAFTLVTNGSNIDCQDGLGITCLMFASAVGNTSLVKLFLDNKANLTFTDNQGLTAVAFAKSKNHQDCVNLLEEYEKKELDSRATLVETKPLVEFSDCSLGEQAANKDEHDSLSQNDGSISSPSADVNLRAVSSSDTGETQHQRDEGTHSPTDDSADMNISNESNTEHFLSNEKISREVSNELSPTEEISRESSEKFSLTEEEISRESSEKFSLTEEISRESSEKFSLTEEISRESSEKFSLTEEEISRESSKKFSLTEEEISKKSSKAFSLTEEISRESSEKFSLTKEISRESSEKFSLTEEISRESSEKFSLTEEEISRESSKKFSLTEEEISKKTSKAFSLTKEISRESSEKFSLTEEISRESSEKFSLTEEEISKESNAVFSLTKDDISRESSKAFPVAVEKILRESSKDFSIADNENSGESSDEFYLAYKNISREASYECSLANDEISTETSYQCSPANDEFLLAVENISRGADTKVIKSEDEVKTKPLELAVSSMTATSVGNLEDKVARIGTGSIDGAPSTSPAKDTKGSTSNVTPLLEENSPLLTDEHLASRNSPESRIGIGRSRSYSVLETSSGLKNEGDGLITYDDLDSDGSEISLTHHQQTLSSNMRSFTDLTSNIETQRSEDTLSQCSYLSDDLALSHMMFLDLSLHPSQRESATLLESTQSAELQESLQTAYRGLQKSKEENDRISQAKLKLEAEVYEYRNKYNQAVSSNMTMENSKCDLQLQLQELKDELDQTREKMISSEATSSQLNEQIDRMELLVSREVEARQDKELKYREIEVVHRSLVVSYRRLEEELSEINGRLQGERESRILQERFYTEQTKMCDLLRAESTKAQESKNEFSNKWELSQTARQDLKTRVCDLSNTNSQLQEELTTVQQRAKDAESELECVSQKLKGKTDLQVQIEDNLQKSQYQFESHLNDLKEKVEFLTNTLDIENCKRSEAEQQTLKLQSKLESVTVEFYTVIKQNEDKECMLTQQVDELRQEKAVKEKELDLTKELYSQEINNTESLEAKLQALENELKVTNTLLHERTNKITGLQHDLNEKQTRVSSLEDTLQSERECESKMESQLCVYNEKVSSLQAEITNLRQRLVLAENVIAERDRTKQEMQKRLESVQTAKNEDQEKARSILHTRVSEKQTELQKTQSELEQLQTALSKAVKEIEEAHCLLKSEIKSKSKLSMKVAELEREQIDKSKLITAEKNRTRKALQMKNGLEWKYESLHNNNVKLTEELASARTHLKMTMRRTQDLEQIESKIPDMRSEFIRVQASLNSEVNSLRELVATTQSDLHREMAKRHKAKQMTKKFQQDLDASTACLSSAKAVTQLKLKESVQAENANKKLREELSALQEHVSSSMVNTDEMEAYKKAVDKKLQLELSQKMEEINKSLEQQSFVQQELARVHTAINDQCREKHDMNTADLKMQLSQSEADKGTVITEAKRYKDLYKSELQRSSNLSSQLKRAKEEAEDSQNTLSQERNRIQQLLCVRQTSASPSRQTSTPLRPGDYSRIKREILQTRLDQSIGSYHDQLPSVATFNSSHDGYFPTQGAESGHGLKKLSHLESITE